jgi:hypothetical protein
VGIENIGYSDKLEAGENRNVFRVSGSRSGGYEEFYFRAYNAM